MPDETTTPAINVHGTDYAEAIRQIQTTAARVAEPKVINVTVPDGGGGANSIPVALLVSAEGGVEARSLMPEVIDASEVSERWRLKHAAGPDRREGTAQLQSFVAFCDHANRFKSADSAVWADAAQRKLVSVLDYHPAGAVSKAAWGKHRGVYACPLSEAWGAWGGGRALKLDQDSFAALLDARDRELADGKLPNGNAAPSPSTLITLANNLEVYSKADAKRERDPNTGRLKISYNEDKGVSGTVMPPPAFLVNIPVFQDTTPQPLEVRLRVTVEEGHALFHVQLHAAADVLRQAFLELCDVAKVSTSLPVFVGTPE